MFKSDVKPIHPGFDTHLHLIHGYDISFGIEQKKR